VVIFVNSKQQDVEAGVTVAALLELLGLALQRVAVEVNGQLVTRSEWPQYKLKDSDRVEVVSFVGGG
jgi:sulfur carrier protein